MIDKKYLEGEIAKINITINSLEDGLWLHKEMKKMFESQLFNLKK